MTQMCVVRIIEKKLLRVRQWKHPVSCRVDFSCWHMLIHVHLSLQVSCTCSTTKPTKHVHLSLGVSCTCLNFLKWHVQPGRVELCMSLLYDRLSQRVKQFRASIDQCPWIHSPCLHSTWSRFGINTCNFH